MNAKRKSAIETIRAIARLFDLYGIDRSLDRDRSQDGERYERALSYAVRDGLLRLPHKRGAPSKWKGKLGLELVQAIESLQAQAGPVIPKNTSKLVLQETIESLRAGRAPTIRLKPLSIPKAIRALQDQYPDKWGAYDDLEKGTTRLRKPGATHAGSRCLVIGGTWITPKIRSDFSGCCWSSTWAYRVCNSCKEVYQ